MRIPILLYVIVYSLTLLLLVRQLFNRRVTKTVLHFSFITALLLCVFPVWSGDYHHIAEQYSELTMGYSTNLESIYVYVAQYITSYYLVFRFIFWGVGFILITLTFNRLHVRFETALFCFVASSLLWYSYARVSVGMAFLFYGLALVATPSKKNRFLSCLGGLLFIGVSFFFHKTALFGITMALMSLIVFNLDGKKFFLLCVGYVFLVFAMSSYLTQYLSLDDEEALLSVDKARRYLEAASSSGGGIGQQIQNILIRTNFYLIFYIVVKTIFKGSYKAFPADIKIFSAATLLIVACATVFAFDLGYNTHVMYYRFLNFAIVPMAIILSYCINNRIEIKLAKISLYLGMVASLYTLLYSFYLN